MIHFNQWKEIDVLGYKSSGLFHLSTTARDDQCSRSIYFIPVMVPLTSNLKLKSTEHRQQIFIVETASSKITIWKLLEKLLIMTAANTDNTNIL